MPVSGTLTLRSLGLARPAGSRTIVGDFLEEDSSIWPFEISRVRFCRACLFDTRFARLEITEIVYTFFCVACTGFYPWVS